MSDATMDIGTAWFSCRTALEKYYLGYYFTPDYSEQLVEVLAGYKRWLTDKEVSGEVHVGSPPERKGEVRRYVGGDGRWRIVVKTGGEK
tara:strand:+ start:4251 stop:4517 length:267 start_codon:yes stop_codon:yes gene_type:complete